MGKNHYPPIKPPNKPPDPPGPGPTPKPGVPLIWWIDNDQARTDEVAGKANIGIATLIAQRDTGAFWRVLSDKPPYTWVQMASGSGGTMGSNVIYFKDEAERHGIQTPDEKALYVNETNGQTWYYRNADWHRLAQDVVFKPSSSDIRAMPSRDADQLYVGREEQQVWEADRDGSLYQLSNDPFRTVDGRAADYKQVAAWDRVNVGRGDALTLQLPELRMGEMFEVVDVDRTFAKTPVTLAIPQGSLTTRFVIAGMGNNLVLDTIGPNQVWRFLVSNDGIVVVNSAG